MSDPIRIVLSGEAESLNARAASAGATMKRLNGKLVAVPYIFTPEKIRTWQNHLADTAKQVMGDRAPLDCAVILVIRVYVKVPVSMPKFKKAKALEGTLYPMSKPDCSNVAKVAEDAIRQIVFTDDARVADLIVSKRYSDRPRIELEIEALADIDGLPTQTTRADQPQLFGGK